MYKPGDVVTVISDMKSQDMFEYPTITKEMIQMAGKEITITEIEDTGCVYANRYWWNPKWIKPAREFEIPQDEFLNLVMGND